MCKGTEAHGIPWWECDRALESRGWTRPAQSQRLDFLLPGPGSFLWNTARPRGDAEAGLRRALQSQYWLGDPEHVT